MKRIFLLFTLVGLLSTTLVASEFVGVDLGYAINKAKVENNINSQYPSNSYPHFNAFYIGMHMGEYVNPNVRTIITAKYKFEGKDTISNQTIKDERVFEMLASVDYMFKKVSNFMPFVGFSAGFSYHKYTLPSVESKNAIGMILGPRAGVSFDISGNMDVDTFMAYKFDTASWDKNDIFIKTMKHIELGSSLNYRF